MLSLNIVVISPLNPGGVSACQLMAAKVYIGVSLSGMSNNSNVHFSMIRNYSASYSPYVVRGDIARWIIKRPPTVYVNTNSLII